MGAAASCLLWISLLVPVLMWTIPIFILTTMKRFQLGTYALVTCVGGIRAMARAVCKYAVSTVDFSTGQPQAVASITLNGSPISILQPDKAHKHLGVWEL